MRTSIRLLIWIFITFLPQCVIFDAKAQFVRSDSIQCFINSDKNPDYITLETDKPIVNTARVRSFTINADNSFTKVEQVIEYGPANFPISIKCEREGIISLEYLIEKILEKNYYQWDNDSRYWQFIGTEYLWGKFCDNCPSLLGFSLDINKVNIRNKSELGFLQELKFENDYERYLQEYKKRSFTTILKHDKFRTLDYLNYVPLDVKTVQKYNDIGFFLCEAGLYQESIYILENVTYSFPERTVVWLNLADAYWLDAETSKNKIINFSYAKSAYYKYLTLMKNSSSTSRIPSRVWERAEEHP